VAKAPKKTGGRKVTSGRKAAAGSLKTKSKARNRTAATSGRKSVKAKRLVSRRPEPKVEAKMKKNSTARPQNGKAAAPAPVPVVSSRLPAPVKPVKNQAGLKARELQSFRDLLVAKRRELLGDVHSMEEEALRSNGSANLSNLPIHMADMGTDNYEQEFTLHLVQKDRELIKEIHIALKKLDDGTYGICEGTGKPISKARLEAKPWARYSIEYARQLEKPTFRPF
jgi:DnaK suppressor protein